MKKYIDLRNTQIAYREENVHRENVLLFIHGNSFSSDYFHLQFGGESLSFFRLIGIDLPGHGDSKRADDLNTYSVPGYAEIIDQFIKQLDLKSVVLVGHSLGGNIALETISRYKLPAYKVAGLYPVAVSQM